MIKAVFYSDKDSLYKGFAVNGHANYSGYGTDIICSAVSALVITTVNSIQKLTDDKVSVMVTENGTIKLKFLSKGSKEAQLLIKSLSIGLMGIYEEYGDRYLRLYFKEV